MANDGYPSTTTILSSMAIIFLTILTEILVNAKLTCSNLSSDGENEGLATTTTTQYMDAGSQTSPLVTTQPQFNAPRLNSPHLLKLDTPKPSPAPPMTCRNQCPGCCHPAAPPAMRANRLATAIILYALLTAAFALRMREIGQSDYVNWVFTLLVNVLPFTSASFAFLRAFVDALLVRWGGGLRYGFSEEDEGGCVWLPCMVVMAPVRVAWCVVGVGVAVLMGRWRVLWWKRKEKVRVGDVERYGDENERLIGEDAGQESRDGEGSEALQAHEGNFVVDK